MGIKDWFTRKSKVKLAVDKPKTILYDLYANSKENNDIYLKLQEIENTLNNIPAIPDLRDYAKKNENNNFKPQSFVSDTPWINFKFRNNQIAGSIHGYNDRFEVKANTENLELKSPKDVVLLPTGNAIYQKTPTDNTHIVNKKYVDDEIAKIPPVDLSNYYTKNEVDTKDTTTLNEAKTYTDGEISKLSSPSGIMFWSVLYTTSQGALTKEYVGGAYKYTNISRVWLRPPKEWYGKKVMVLVCVHKITNISQTQSIDNINQIYLHSIFTFGNSDMEITLNCGNIVGGDIGDITSGIAKAPRTEQTLIMMEIG